MCTQVILISTHNLCIYGEIKAPESIIVISHYCYELKLEMSEMLDDRNYVILGK